MSGSLESRHGVIALWSAPRSRSTAFLRMMMEWDDLVTVHEPFSRLINFGESDVAGTVVRTEAELIDALSALAKDKTVFFKDTTDYPYPGLLADKRFLQEAQHTFIIRDPREAIASHYALNPALDRDEIGFERLHELFAAVTAANGRAPVVVDADDLVTDAPSLVRAYCARVGLPFHEERLAWEPKMPADWQRTERWHTAAGQTGAFVQTGTKYDTTVDNNAKLAEFHDYHLPFYRQLREHRLIPADARSPTSTP